MTRFFHFSKNEFQPGEILVGMKASHKSQQRTGQAYVDEIFEQQRKDRFPNAPSLFTSLWVTDVFDPSIPRKHFQENTELAYGYLYAVEPVAQSVYEIEPYWEVLACRSVTQSGMKGKALLEYVKEMAQKFWRPELIEGPVRDFLCPLGASVVALHKVVHRTDVL